jgi:hypothetical protein
MGNVYTRQQYWGNYDKGKEAEVGDIMPNSSSGDKPDKGAKSVIPKVASAVGLPDGVQAAHVKGEQAEKNPQAKPINPRVRIEGKEPPKVIKEKTASHFAMPSIQRYPIDDYGQVKQAAVYFEEHRGQFEPIHRREFCLNLVKRASDLGIPVSSEIHSYGGVGYASPAELEVAIGTRRSLLLDEDHLDLLGKLAEARVGLTPDEFALALGEFDKVAGLAEHYDRDVLDPFMCIFKSAEANDSDESFVLGNDIVTAPQLHVLASSPCKNISDRFGEDFLKEFRKDPVGIFKSLPTDQKKVISREANEPVLSN